MYISYCGEWGGGQGGLEKDPPRNLPPPTVSPDLHTEGAEHTPPHPFPSPLFLLRVLPCLFLVFYSFCTCSTGCLSNKEQQKRARVRLWR